MSYAKQIVIAQVAKARKGNVQAFWELMDSTIGKVKEVHQIDEPEKINEFVVTVVKEPQKKQKNAIY